MPERETLRRARADARAGKSASTQAGEFVREEIHHIREGKHGASSAKQAIAIGLSKARRAGVPLRAPSRLDPKVRRQAKRDAAKAGRGAKPLAARSRASLRKLQRKSRQAASKAALSRHAKQVARARRRTR
jgi:hypothetical protein